MSSRRAAGEHVSGGREPPQRRAAAAPRGGPRRNGVKTLRDETDSALGMCRPTNGYVITSLMNTTRAFVTVVPPPQDYRGPANLRPTITDAQNGAAA